MPRIKYSATQFSVSFPAKEVAMLARIAKSVESKTYVKISRSEAVRCAIRAFDESLEKEEGFKEQS